MPPPVRTQRDGRTAGRVPRGQTPLMVFSHGHLVFGGGNHAVARQFVRNGWTVVAPVHTGNTTFDSIEPLPLDFEAVRADDRDLRATRPLRRAPVVTPAWHTLARAARWTAVAARPGSWSRALVP